MQKLAHNLPLQDLIRGVIQNAKTKLAEENKEPEKKDDKVKTLLKYEKKEHGGHIPSVKEEEEEKMASLTDPMFVEKLASACDFIAEHVDEIRPAAKGVIESALAKLASGKTAPPAVPTAGVLKATEAVGGKQVYTKDQAKINTPEKEVGSALSAGGLPGGKTQLENNMHEAPGGGDVKPTAKYPEKGPFVNQEKTAQLRQAILNKLAGEDVLKANISASKSGGALSGQGVLKNMDATQPQDGPGGVTSGFGNQARKLIASNKAVIDATKGEAKQPVKEQLKQVITEPALSPKTDSKLQENLRNTSKAGVKIAAQRANLLKIASSGTPQEKEALRNLVKQAETDGGDMTATADAGAAPDGCTCGQSGECRVCKLKSALNTARGGSQGSK